MASLPENSTPEQIEDEIVFIEVQIDTLDPDADDFAQNLAELRSQHTHLQDLLRRVQEQSRVPASTDGNAANEISSRRDAGWQAVAGNYRDGTITDSDDESSATLSSQEHPHPSGSKRPRPASSHRFADAPASKRLIPNTFASAPSPPDSSKLDFVQRAKQRHQLAESALRRQQELNRSDAALARQMSRDHASPTDFGLIPSSSSQPRTQTTLSFDGGYHRLPSIKSEAGLHPEPAQQPQPPQQVHVQRVPQRHLGPNEPLPPMQVGRNLPWSISPSDQASRPQQSLYPNPNQVAPGRYQQPPIPQHVKSESSQQRHQQLYHTPRQSASVIDLTASDSDNDEVKEIGSRPLPSIHSAPGPSRIAPQYLQTGHGFGLPQMPGSYPGSAPAYPQYHSSAINPQHMPLPTYPPIFSAAPGARAFGLDQQMATMDASRLLNGSGSRAAWYGDFDDHEDDDDDYDDDDDLIYSGSRHLPRYGQYAGNEDLYQRRYDALAAYDSTKSKEEIQALLQNIRPDEDMPLHLRVKTPDAMSISLHKYQEMGLTWLQKCEDGSNKGGILADDMGLGKTIQMLSLMVTHRSQDPRCKTTLIVAPVALMRQWRQEIEQKIKPGVHRLTVFVHHGPSKKKDFRDLQHFDVVLTTYGSLAVEVKKMEALRKRQIAYPGARPGPKEKCALLGEDARWHRVILDEAQCIKNKSTQTARGACMVNAKFRWCMSGTPMMNNVEELFSLIHFLRIKPYSQWEKFRLDFKTPLKNPEPEVRGMAMRKLQALCKAVMLRRTKKSEYEGVPILVLPERTTAVDNPVFSQDESDFYQAVETRSQLQFNKYLRKGTVGSSYSAILVLLLRLRQACCHPHLLKDFGVSAAADMTETQLLEMANLLPVPVVARIKETGGNFECPVCYDVTPNPAIFVPCGHDVCSECLARLTDPAQAIAHGEEGANRFKCPNCRGPIDPKRLTDFASFKKLHAPEMLTEQEAQAMVGDDDEAEEDSDDGDIDSYLDGSDDDSDEEEADDDEDPIRDFVVDDDAEEEEEDEEEEAAKVAPEDEDDLDNGVSDGIKQVAGDEQEESDDDDLDKPVVKRDKSTAEKSEEGIAGSSVSASKAKPKSKKKSKSKKGKGKAKEKEKRKTVKTTITLAELKKRANRNIASRKAYLKRLRKDYISSAKIDKTMDILRGVMDGEEGEKVLIFSQWTSLLDLLEIPIDDCGWGYRRYDGSMNARMRGDAVDDFRDSKQNVRIMLVSLKAGNAGLNLNMASQVIILDPFWNPYIEEQAIDRAHRIGQVRPVQVHRVLIENTVEDRIIELQDKKRALISEALDEKASQSISRLGVQELAYLFGVTHNPSARVDYTPRDRRA